VWLPWCAQARRRAAQAKLQARRQALATQQASELAEAGAPPSVVAGGPLFYGGGGRSWDRTFQKN
jgi:hypothetical protein